ncbi:glycosyltransferase [Lacinutrix sp. C3R15]|uniref:glycosyltransferase n=1 Tax=Flavobacteriaceae TaxID=49546 RepID=UPI001C0A399D|nr:MULTISPECIES: glycosyltransferase [Flavobacteriaceae]MBU2939563.1 glycosyltransferase [Lacinutrix sp. C3R15]MDO6622877.1 glycosyltransferase [Oceanihabitans sp. 1_MG-2023]
MLKKGVSIVLCTYNGKNRLAKTLGHLAAQKLDVPCEIIFVDNASTDGTKAFADTWWATHGTSKITYLSFEQPIPGKSYAQDLGYEKANYNYLLVCDDDNWLCDTYVQNAFDIMESNSQIGALGGWCDAAFEGEKPDWFATYSKYFAVSKQGVASGDITTKKGCLYGAGMVLNKTHWLELKSLGFVHLLSCRKGTSLSSGGDTEYSYALRLLGYKIWYDERLYFTHYMTAGRMHLDYLSRLRKAMSYSNFILWSYKDLIKGSSNRQWKPIQQYGVLGFVKRILVKTRDYITGDYEEKEKVKLYFRTLYYTLFYKKMYEENYTFITKWLKHKSA